MHQTSHSALRHVFRQFTLFANDLKWGQHVSNWLWDRRQRLHGPAGPGRHQVTGQHLSPTRGDEATGIDIPLGGPAHGTSRTPAQQPRTERLRVHLASLGDTARLSALGGGALCAEETQPGCLHWGRADWTYLDLMDRQSRDRVWWRQGDRSAQSRRPAVWPTQPPPVDSGEHC